MTFENQEQTRINVIQGSLDPCGPGGQTLVGPEVLCNSTEGLMRYGAVTDYLPLSAFFLRRVMNFICRIPMHNDHWAVQIINI